MARAHAVFAAGDDQRVVEQGAVSLWNALELLDQVGELLQWGAGDHLIHRRPSSIVRSSILFSSCDVRNPSKKCRNGTRYARVAIWATIARSCTSCTEADASMAHPVLR